MIIHHSDSYAHMIDDFWILLGDTIGVFFGYSSMSGLVGMSTSGDTEAHDERL